MDFTVTPLIISSLCYDCLFVMFVCLFVMFACVSQVLGVHWVPRAGWGDPNNPEAEDTANTVSLLLYSLAR